MLVNPLAFWGSRLRHRTCRRAASQFHRKSSSSLDPSDWSSRDYHGHQIDSPPNCRTYTVTVWILKSSRTSMKGCLPVGVRMPGQLHCRLPGILLCKYADTDLAVTTCTLPTPGPAPLGLTYVKNGNKLMMRFSAASFAWLSRSISNSKRPAVTCHGTS